MCGIAGIVTPMENTAAYNVYDALKIIQHRGQDSAGIATGDGKHLNIRRGNGLLRDVFKDHHMEHLGGGMGIGHVRYPTAGSSSFSEAQPMYVNSPYGLVLAHNGNLINDRELREELTQIDLRHLNTRSDSETLLNVLAHELAACGKVTPETSDMFTAVSQVHRRCKGAYAVVAMIMGYGLLGFRDPCGIRPLILGRRLSEKGYEHMLASESVALSALGFEVVRDVQPGEAVFIDLDGNVHAQQCADRIVKSPCVFEYVYLARPDSMMDGVSIYKARLRMGEFLAEKIMKQLGDQHIDVVIPIPDTSRTSALPIAHKLGVKYREGFIKNRYIGRTFIMPGQMERKKSVKQKLNPIPLEFSGKNVLLIDDSIVRGTTSKQIVQMARDAGAHKVFMASASPPVRHPNVYGIDMPCSFELIAYNRSEDQIAAEIGADGLVYQDIPDLIESVRSGSADIDRCDASCFDGDYVSGGVTEQYLRYIEDARNDKAKSREETLMLNLEFEDQPHSASLQA